MRVSVRLSQLVCDRKNVRRNKPEREAHRRLVASIRAHGLIEPLVVRSEAPGTDRFKVVAGKRRLAALRDAFRGEDPKLSCELRDVDDDGAQALSLAENFAREAMHPLDEAEAFARLASVECKGVAVIAAEFGVSSGYVRQRMKLATLAEPIRSAYRDGAIDTGTAEAFAAVPPDRQLEVWREVEGAPRHAAHVRHIIEHGWIDAEHALFDVGALPEAAVTRDLFSERVLIERKAFMEAQAEALLARRHALTEDGWREAVVAHRADVQDRLYAMSDPVPEYDAATTAKLAAIEDERAKVEAEFDESDDAEAEALQARLEALDEREAAVARTATPTYSEATKAVGTAFLILDPNGRAHVDYRVPRARVRVSESSNGHVSAPGGGGDGFTDPKAPTSDDLSDRQTGTTYAHEALAVRAAVMDSQRTRKVLLTLVLHDKVRKEALAFRHEANGTDLHADHAEGFASPALDALRGLRAAVDPLTDRVSLDESEAYALLRDLPDVQLDRLIDVLLVGSLTAHPTRTTPLVRTLARDLGVDVRRCWRPDERWLNSYKKCQLAHLIGELRGPVHGSAAERRKKSELVAELATLFADAAEGRVDDAALAGRVNRWLPSNLRREEGSATNEASPAAA